MLPTTYRYPSANSFVHLRAQDEGRWALLVDGREICSYSSAEKAAQFVARGLTGNSLIDRMPIRPRTLADWDRSARTPAHVPPPVVVLTR